MPSIGDCLASSSTTCCLIDLDYFLVRLLQDCNTTASLSPFALGLPCILATIHEAWTISPPALLRYVIFQTSLPLVCVTGLVVGHTLGAGVGFAFSMLEDLVTWPRSRTRKNGLLPRSCIFLEELTHVLGAKLGFLLPLYYFELPYSPVQTLTKRFLP